MMRVYETEEEIDKLLTKVDPYNNKKMTYSEVVFVLSQEMVPRIPDSTNPSRRIAVLEKFISESDNNLDDEINAYRGAYPEDNDTNRDLPSQAEMTTEAQQVEEGNAGNESGEMTLANDD